MKAVRVLFLSMVALSSMRMRKLHCACAMKPWIIALLPKWSKVNLFHSNLDIDFFMKERGHCYVQNEAAIRRGRHVNSSIESKKRKQGTHELKETMHILC